jgi:DNA-binding response OmpR family regulator
MSPLKHGGQCAALCHETPAGLELDVSERIIRGVSMQPLLTGEFKLLAYLGDRPCTWHTSYQLSLRVYGRDDAAGRQLVWKYASTLRRKLAASQPCVIELCRRRGYSCQARVRVVAGEFDDHSAQLAQLAQHG